MINLKPYILSFTIIYFIVASINLSHALDTGAREAYLVDFNTNTCLFEKDGEKLMSPSSMTKVMTSYVVFSNLKENNLNPDDELSVSENAWRTGGTKMFVGLNTKIKVEDLIRGVIVLSGNDASKVLAEGISGDETTFAESMNEYAKQLGMHNSHFMNASGLPDENHYSTAKDIAILAAAVIRNFPEYYPYFSEKEFTYNKIHQYNKNTLLGKRGVDGLKTGHTEAGGFGIVVSATRDNRRLIAVVNGLSTEKERIREADKLLNYGFSNFMNKKIFKAGDIVTEADIWYGKQEKAAIISPTDIEIVLPKSVGKKSHHTIKVVYNSPLKAPIKQGDIIAKLIVEDNGQEILAKDLTAKEDIEQANLIERVMQNLKYYIGKLKL